MTTRVFNFSAGPATLPLAVLQSAGQSISNWHDSGVGVMEMSHRSAEFMSIYQQAQDDLRQLLELPDNFHILFAQGGATVQFAMAPLNIAGDKTIDFALTGIWSRKAYKEAQRYNPTNLALDFSAQSGQAVPAASSWNYSTDAAYLHICSNETIEGVELPHWPDLATRGKNIPLVVDCSSNILSRRFDWRNVGVAIAGAQKNIGPSGLSIVIVRADLLDKAKAICPSIFNYRQAVDNQSMLNTPPTWGIYLAALVFKWLLAKGGIDVMEQENQRKAQLLYAYIDGSDFYRNSVAVANRSRMNVPFLLADAALDAAFLAQAQQQGLVGLKGHKLVGGMRASIYNAMPIQGVQALITFMQEFEKQYR